jgi:SAM-dependent methyltransferase
MERDLNPAEFIEPETSDSDSAIGDTNSSAYTESLRSSLFQSIQENGRGYHKYRDGHYFIPEDEQEQERLDMQHEIFLITMGRKLYYSPLSRESLQNVLDIGTGTGIWAIDFANDHPSPSVIGTDLSPIQPSFVPPNCKFEVDDYEEPWTFAQKFDFVHGRMLAGSVGDGEALFRQVYDGLIPGGWFELQDFAFPVRSDDGTMNGTSFEELNENLCKALRILGRDAGLAEKYKTHMLNAGFQNVVEVKYKWPQNQWPKDKFLKQLGLWNMVNTLDGLHGFSARLCTQVLGMSTEELELLLMACRNDIKNTKIHAYWPMSVFPPFPLIRDRLGHRTDC